MSWGDAYIDLQSALLNTECSEVWVAEGTYKPGALRSDSFVVRPGVDVYGGFVGTETDIHQRNWVTHVTRLSGDIGNVGDNSDNSYHVVLMDGTVGTQIITLGTVLDGLVITAGNANNSAKQNDRGGGMLCKGAGIGNDCSPEVYRITFSDNFALYGGAMYNQGNNGGTSSPILTDVAFSDNSASKNGGAVFNDGSNGGASTPLMERVTFDGNTATGSRSVWFRRKGRGYLGDGVNRQLAQRSRLADGVLVRRFVDAKGLVFVRVDVRLHPANMRARVVGDDVGLGIGVDFGEGTVWKRTFDQIAMRLRRR